MDIPTYRRKHGLSQAAFAAILTKSGSPATQSLVSQWEGGAVLVPPERWVSIESVTNKEVTRADLRPDVFGPAPKKRKKAA
jgi:DNA-binding transcriptional regulator YdaS (Cro superfamily)